MMEAHEIEETKDLFEQAEETLEMIDPEIQRPTERDMRDSALKNIRHSIGRLDGMLEIRENTGGDS